MSMTITLGKSGRLVVPKAMRDSLWLQEGNLDQTDHGVGAYPAL